MTDHIYMHTNMLITPKISLLKLHVVPVYVQNNNPVMQINYIYKTLLITPLIKVPGSDVKAVKTIIMII